MVVLTGAGCGGDDDAPPSQPAPTADDALIVRLHQHQTVAQELASSAARDADAADIRRLAARVRRTREQMLRDLEPRRREIAQRDPEGRGELPDLGVSREQAAEDITPGALRGVSPYDTSFLALLAKHDEGALTLVNAGAAQATNAETKALARRLQVRYEQELAQLRAAIADASAP
ncbi:DUF305 domain-containing protein [Svornostia abyssi]|uniref:DUF305 domain-containing protein n=1 Tax=Svornostia abyssi TaxID=2898438 RepID=A0ABY5PE77_9ACTN|nr:DUF305 domain-containing protein [Parviterribacteraceae bacterium J379]